MAKENRGRNDIVRALNQEGIKISAGSVSNIIVESRKQKTLFKSNTSSQEENQDRRQHSDTERVTTFPEEGLAETEFKKKDISIENHAIVNTQDFEKNGYASEGGQNGGPLSWFTNIQSRPNDYDASINSATPINIDAGSPVDGVGLAPFQPKDGGPLSWCSDINNDVPNIINNEQNETPEEFEEPTQHEFPAPIAPNQGPSVTIEEGSKQLVDWDENHVSRLWRRVTEETARINSRGKQLKQVEYDLNVRQGQIRELEPYLGFAKKLQEMNLTLEDAQPWFDSVNEVAKLEKLDKKSASIYITQELILNRQLGGLRREVQKANQELALINMEIAQKQQALQVLTDLSRKGVTEAQIMGLIDFAAKCENYWQNNSNSQQQQQQSNNGNHQQLNNGLSHTAQIKLNLLRNVNANILNKMRV